MTTQPTAATRSTSDSKFHPTEYLRILYKRRWVAIPGFLLLFVTSAVESMQSIPIYEAQTQILVEPDAPRQTSIDRVLEGRDDYDESFYTTQYRLMESRTLALRTAEALERAGVEERVPEARWTFSLRGTISSAVSSVGSLFTTEKAEAPESPSQPDETSDQQGKIDGFLGGLDVSPVRGSRLEP